MTHPDETVEEAVGLAQAGLSATEVAAATGVARGTVRDWIAGRVPARLSRKAEVDPERLPPDYVYLLGLYLGDGCLSAHPRGVYKLRVSLDSKYPNIIASAVRAIQAVLPGNSVRTCARRVSRGLLLLEAWPQLFPSTAPAGSTSEDRARRWQELFE